MQCFNIAIRRRLTLEPLLLEEIEDYCFFQCYGLKADEIQEKINYLRKKVNDGNCWIIAIKMNNMKEEEEKEKKEKKEKEVIGIIEVDGISEGEAKASIEIPNMSPRYQREGEEAVDQFVKVCIDRKYFSKIELSEDNSIMHNYCIKYCGKRPIKGNKVVL